MAKSVVTKGLWIHGALSSGLCKEEMKYEALSSKF